MAHFIHDREIALAKTDVIVNAANGCGYMGGETCTSELHRGVAEHLNFYTHGAMEKEALKVARKYNKIPSWLIGTKAGNFFVTDSFGLDCKVVIHAVTMRYPASSSNIKRVAEVVHKIFEYCNSSGYKSISIPLLGCGTGGLSAEKVAGLIRNKAAKYPDIDVYIYINRENKL
ncbi:MAG: macro domain-containing protein [Oscillospiraceae bacterium]|nr:macro domain-containing protein [Oscillospiraceae bacterium]